MAVLYLYRLASLVLATLCAVVVLGLSAHTSFVANNFTRLVNVIPNDYANVGIAAGSMTLVSVVLSLLLDFTAQKIRATIIIEALWMTLLSILFVVTGALAFKAFSASEVESFYGVIQFQSCKDLVFGSLIDICDDSRYIGIFAFITAGILFLYTLVILAVGATKYKREASVWNMPLEEAEKV